MMFDIKPYLLLLWKWRWFLGVNFILVAAASAYLAFYVVKPEFSSQATFLPPTSSPMSLMGASANPLLGMLSGDESGDNIEAVFESRALKRRIIEEFNLYENYALTKSPNKFEQAVKRMQKQVMLESEQKGKGIGMSKTISYSVQSYHTDPDTAYMMTRFVFASLDSTMVDISINRARRNREFIEEQFRASRAKLDSIQDAFKVFQLQHNAFDISEQVKLTLKVYAELKSAAVMNDMRLQALRREFRGSSPEIVEAESMKRIYERQLSEFEKSERHTVLPSLSMASELTPEYTNLYRSLEVQNQINLLLIRELEQARLQEARDVSPLVLIDPPYVAEYKARPKRVPMIVAITGGYMMFLCIIIVGRALFSEFIRGLGAVSPKPEK